MDRLTRAPGRDMFDERKLDAELRDLDDRRLDLDRRIRDAVLHQRHDAAHAAAARDEEQTLLREMDRVMTRIRAVEAKLLILRKQKA